MAQVIGGMYSCLNLDEVWGHSVENSGHTDGQVYTVLAVNIRAVLQAISKSLLDQITEYKPTAFLY